MKTVGGTIMAGFLLMLLLDEGVSIYRDYQKARRLEITRHARNSLGESGAGNSESENLITSNL